jgi:hypothetical protein
MENISIVIIWGKTLGKFRNLGQHAWKTIPKFPQVAKFFLHNLENPLM